MKYNNISKIALQAIQLCINKGISFVCFRLPHEEAQLWITTTNKHQKTGFVFHPFCENEGEALYFQPLKVYDLKSIHAAELEEIAKTPDVPHEIEAPENFPYVASKEEYLLQANECMEWLGWQTEGKVVLSRIKEFPEYNYSNGATLFAALEHHFSDALCYILYSAQSGYWCGAFQEHLLQKVGNSYYSEALAGTQMIKGNEAPLWNEKEIHEQKLVANYLTQKLKSIGVFAIQEDECKTVRSGQIAHLQTAFKFKLTPEQVETFIAEVHPTPAICGLPKEEAFQLIRTVETHQRNYYSGLVGLLDYNDQTQLFINLRCMQLFKEGIYIYAGGGLTSDSSPEEEWEETEWKINNIIHSIELFV